MGPMKSALGMRQTRSLQGGTSDRPLKETAPGLERQKKGNSMDY